MIVMRLDPKKHTLTTISMPRDMKVDIPGYGTEQDQRGLQLRRRDARARDRARQVLGIKINYLITVNFTGFRRVVDDVGGVYIDVERRYYNQNGQPGSGDYTNIDLKAGYQKLNGVDALAYVRFRHQDSDIFRLARQQQFLRELKHKLDLTTVGVNFVSLVNDVSSNVKIVSQYKHTAGPEHADRRTPARSPRCRSRAPCRSSCSATRAAAHRRRVRRGRPARDHSRPCRASCRPTSRSRTQARGHRRHAGRASRSRRRRRCPPIAPKKLKVVTLNGSGVDLASATAATALRERRLHARRPRASSTETQTRQHGRRRTSRRRPSTTRRQARQDAPRSKLRIALFDANVAPAPRGLQADRRRSPRSSSSSARTSTRRRSSRPSQPPPAADRAARGRTADRPRP